MLISAIVTISVFSFTSGGLNEKVSKQQIEIQHINQNKVDRNETNYIINSLSRIESKLDTHISTVNK